MTAGTLLTLGDALWVGLLFAAALLGERRPQAFARHWSWVYALSLAVQRGPMHRRATAMTCVAVGFGWRGKQ